MRTLLATAATVLLLGTLAACSDDAPQPTFQPSTEAATSSPPPSASDPPPSSDPPKPETAASFLRRWQAEAFEMQNSGDTTAYREMSLRCESCDSLADRVDSVYDAGGWIRTDGGSVRNLKEVGGQGRLHIFEYVLKSAPTIYRQTSEGSKQRLGGGTARYQVNVLRRGDSYGVVTATGIPM